MTKISHSVGNRTLLVTGKIYPCIHSRMQLMKCFKTKKLQCIDKSNFVVKVSINKEGAMHGDTRLSYEF